MEGCGPPGWPTNWLRLVCLAGAGVEPVVPEDEQAVDPRYRTVVAWVLREAVTNVVRHSGARRCEVVLAPDALVVRDDGRGLDGSVEGNGLRGLRERVEGTGGRLVLGCWARRGVRGGVVVSEPIRVLLADDQVLVRDALATLLSFERDIEVVARVSRGDEVAPAVARERPAVCLLDIEMPGLDGVAACREVTTRFPEVRVLMVTTFGRPGYLRRALDAGATGFVVKDIPGAQLADAVRRVHAGHRVVDPTLATETLLGGAAR